MGEIDNKPVSPADEIAELKRQMEQMQERLAQLSAAADGARGDVDAAADEESEPADDVAGGEVADDVCDGREEQRVVSVGDESGDAATSDVCETEPEGVCVEANACCASDDSNCADEQNADDCGKQDAAFSEGSQSRAAVEPVPAPETSAFHAPAPAQQGHSAHSFGSNASQGYAAYVPPSAPTSGVQGASYSAASASSTQHSGAGAPTPPPAYDATAAYSGQSGASAPRAEYAQPTGQQAYQSGTTHAGGYASPSQAAYNPYAQTYYQQPVVRTKDHVAAGLLGIFLGTFGIHKFYLGYSTAGLIMLGVAILGGLLSLGLATMVVWLIGLIEGIIYLVKSQGEFEQAYVFGKREWF